MSTSRLAQVFGFVVLGLALSGIAWANGEEFFHPDETGFDLYYFGHIKDKAGKVLDNVVITIKAKNLGMSFPVRNDAPGHFRSDRHHKGLHPRLLGVWGQPVGQQVPGGELDAEALNHQRSPPRP